MAIGVFATRIIKDVEAAHPGTSIKVGERATQQIDHLASKLKLSPAGQFDEMDKAAIKAFTKDVVQSLAASEKGLTAQNLRSFQKAYSHSLLVEFPEGPGAEAAIREFRKSVNESLAELRQQTKPSAATNQVLVRRVDAAVEKDMADPKVIRRAAREQAQEEIAQANAAAGRSNAGPTGPASNQTEAERAAAAREAMQRKNTIDDAIFTSRTNIVKGLRGIEQGGYPEKKAAFDLIEQGMEGSGYILRPQNATEAAEMAKQAAGRSVEDIRNLLLTRPGQDANGNFINGIINQAEWTKLRSSLRGDLLVSEQKALTDNLDVVRRSLTTKLKPEDLKSTFIRLRAISDDPDYQVDDAAQGVSPKIKTPKEAQESLLAGQKVSREDLNRLETYYSRYHTEQPAVASNPGVFSRILGAVTGGKYGGGGATTTAAKEPSAFDRATEWETGQRYVKPVMTGVRVGATAIGVTAAAGTVASIPLTIVNPDNETPILGEVGRGVTAALPLGFANVPGAALLPELYYSKMERDPSYRKKVLESDTTGMNASKLQARAVQLEKISVEQQASSTAQTTSRELGVATAQADATRGIQSLGSGSLERTSSGSVEKGVPLSLAEEAVVQVASETNPSNPSQSMMSIDQMTKLAAVIADKSKGGSVATLSSQEYEAVKQHDAFTGLQPSAQTRLDELLKPHMPKP